MNKNLLLAYYGDDFTGSTDALEFLCRAGARTILFINTPGPEQLQKYPGIQAIGVAGKTRSMSPAHMEAALLPAFQQLQLLQPRHVHYKVCSTFDSSPDTGSIGKAIDTGASVFKRKFIPLLVAAPALGRYCLFGNLFARMGIGSNGEIFRLDRHPSMSKHPVTPSTESDLRLHTAKQTSTAIALLDILQLNKSIPELRSQIESFTKEEETIVLIDALSDVQLLPIGELIDGYAEETTLFSAGSSGIEMALGSYWNHTQVLTPKTSWANPGIAEPLLVISGSCSPVTAAQIAWAKENGFAEIIIHGNDEADVITAVTSAIEILTKKQSLVIHTGEKQTRNLPAKKTGFLLGSIAKSIIEKTKLKRLVISGGDTSSYAASALEIEAVEMMAPLVAGAPLCKAISENNAINELEVNFKGGQVGAADYFGVLQQGAFLSTNTKLK